VVGMTQKLIEAMILEAVFTGDMELVGQLKNLTLDNLNTRQLAAYLVDRLQDRKVNTKKNKLYEVEEFELEVIR
jgi:hypothetical protein